MGITLKSAAQEIKELKAQVGLLKSIPHVCGGYGCRHCETINKTPEQCVNDIKADAIENAMRKLAKQLDDGLPPDCVCTAMQCYANKIRGE